MRNDNGRIMEVNRRRRELLGIFIALFLLSCVPRFGHGIRGFPHIASSSRSSAHHHHIHKGDEVSVVYQVIDYFNLNLPNKYNINSDVASSATLAHKTIMGQSLLHFGRPKGRILKPKSHRRRRKKRRKRRRPRHPFAPMPSPSTAPSPTVTPEGPPRDELPAPYPSVKPKPEPSSKPKPIPQEKTGTKDNSKERKLLIIAIASSTVATIAILSLFFICFIRIKKKRRRRESNGEQRESNSGQREGSLPSSGSLLKSKKVASRKDVMKSLSSKSSSIPGDEGSESQPHAPLPSTSQPPPSQEPPPPPPPPPPPTRTPPPEAPAPEAPPPPPVVPNPPKPKPPPPGNETNKAGDSDVNKTKLKPFFWDKVNTSPNRSMVWNDIRAGSFQFNEEMMENLFGYNSSGQNKTEDDKNIPNLQNQPKFIQIIEPKKAQNLAILLKALNVTIEEVSDAIMEGNELPVEFISTLLKMPPTPEEEQKLRSYSGNLALLGPSERFLKVLVDIPFAFKRLEALLFMSSLQEESSSVKDSFSTLEVACTTLRNSRLFLKLLEAVLKTGNRMNVGTYRGGAHAFKLDTLLKLSDVKGTDGKTTLLSFVVQEMIRSEGNKAAQTSSEEVSQESSKGKYGLEVVSKLSEELDDVKKAALIDGDTLTSTVLKLGNMLRKTKGFLNNEMKSVEEDFRLLLAEFVERAEMEIMWLLEEEKRVMSLVKSTGDYFHGQSRKDEGLHLFVVVRDFLVLLDNVCNDIRRTAVMKSKKSSQSEESHKLFPSNKSGCSSSDGETDDSS